MAMSHGRKWRWWDSNPRPVKVPRPGPTSLVSDYFSGGRSGDATMTPTGLWEFRRARRPPDLHSLIFPSVESSASGRASLSPAAYTLGSECVRSVGTSFFADRLRGDRPTSLAPGPLTLLSSPFTPRDAKILTKAVPEDPSRPAGLRPRSQYHFRGGAHPKTQEATYFVILL